LLKKLFTNIHRIAQFEVAQLQAIFKEVKITFLQTRHFFVAGIKAQ
jgi:hypothetical protein